MATEADNIPPAIAESCREEKETEKLNEVANVVVLDKPGGIAEPLPDVRKHSEVADTKERIEESNNGSIEGECFYKSPSVAKVADERKISEPEQNEAAEVLHETEGKVSESSIGNETTVKHVETISTIKENPEEEIQQISKEPLSGHDAELNVSIVTEDNADLCNAHSCVNAEGETSKSKNPNDLNEEAPGIGEYANRNLSGQLNVTPTEETCLPKVASDDMHTEATKSSEHLPDVHITAPVTSSDGDTQTSITSQSLSMDKQNEKKEAETSKNNLVETSVIADVSSNKDVNLEEDTSSTLEKTSQDIREIGKSDTNSEECQSQSMNKSGYSCIESEDVPPQKDEKPFPSTTVVPENVSCSQNLPMDADTEPNSKVGLASTETPVGEYKDEERCIVAPKIHTEAKEQRRFKDDETFLPQSETIQMNPEEPLNVAPDEIDASAPCQNIETATTIEKQRLNASLLEVSKEGSKDEPVDADSGQEKQTLEGKNVLPDTTKDLKTNISLAGETKQGQDFEERSITESSNCGEAMAVGAPDIDITSTSQLVADKLETEIKSNTTNGAQPLAENNPEEEVSEKQDCEAPSPIESTIHGSETTVEASSVTSLEEACMHKEESSISEPTSKSLEEIPDGSGTEGKEKEYEAGETLPEEPQHPVREIQFSDSQSAENDKYDKSVGTGDEKSSRDDHCLRSEIPKEDIDGLAIPHSTANEILPEKLGKEYREASMVESENPEIVPENVTMDADTEPNSKVGPASTEASVGEYKDEERCIVAPEIHTEAEEQRIFKDDEIFLPQSETIQMNPEEPLNVAPADIDASVPCQNTETATSIEKQRSNVSLPEVSKEGTKDEPVAADLIQEKRTLEGKNGPADTTKDLKTKIPLVGETKHGQEFEENSITESSNSAKAMAEGAPDIDATSTSQLVTDKLETETKSNTTDGAQTCAENNPEDKLQHEEVSEKQDCEAPSPIENTIHGSETTIEASSVTSSEQACMHKEESSISESTSKSLEEIPDGSGTEAKEKEYEAGETLAEEPQHSMHEIRFSDSQSAENDKNDKYVGTGDENSSRDDHCLSSEIPKEDIDGLAISHSTANEILPEKLGKEYREASLVESENPEIVLESVSEVHHSEETSVVSEAEKTFTDDHSVSSEISKDVHDLTIPHSTDNEILTVKVVTQYNEASPVEPENSEKILESVVQVHDSKVDHGIEESETKEESVEAATTEVGIENIHQEGTNEARGTAEDHIPSEKIRDEDSPFDSTEKEIIQEECPSKTVTVISETMKNENKGEVARDQEIEASKNAQTHCTDEHKVANVLNEDSAADSMPNKSLGEEEESKCIDEAPKEQHPEKYFDELGSGHTQTEVKCSAEEILSSEVQHDEDGGIDDKEDSIEQKSQAQNENVSNSLVDDIRDLEGANETETKSTTRGKVQTQAENNTEDQPQQHGEVSEKQDHEALSPIENTLHGSETTFEASSVSSSEEACIHKEESSVSESRSKSLEEMQHGSTTEGEDKELEAEETLAEQPQQPVHGIQFSDSQSVENDENDKSMETGKEKTSRDDHCLSSESPKEDLDDLAISHSTPNEILPKKLGKEYHEASPFESENAEKLLKSVNQVPYSEDISVVSEAEKTFTDDHSVSSKISKDVEDLAISHPTDNEILTVNLGTEYNEASAIGPKNSENILESVVQVHDSKVSHEKEERDMKEESVEAETTEIGVEKIHQEGTNEAKGTIEDYISSEKIRDKDSPIDCTEKEIIQEEFPSKTVLVISETIKSENEGEDARDQEIEASKNIENQNTDEHEIAKGLHDDSTADSMLNKNPREEGREFTDETPKELNPQKDINKLESGHTRTEAKCSAEEVPKGVTDNIASEAEHKAVLPESTEDSDVNNKSSTAAETNKVAVAADSKSSESLMDHKMPYVRPIETLSEENEASRDFSEKGNKYNEDEPEALSPGRAAFEESSTVQEDESEKQHCIISTQPTEENSTGNNEERDKDEEAKEKNENQATAATGASDTKGGEAACQTSITGEDQNSNYSDVKLASLSPKQSTADKSHTEEHLDIAEPTDVIPDVIDLSKASPAVTEMQTSEELQSSESTEVILPTTGKGTEPLQKDLAITTVQNDTQKVESESDPSKSETVRVESEEKGASNEPEEVKQDSTSIEPATDSEPNLTQGSVSETLAVAEERETLDQMEKDHISEHAKPVPAEPKVPEESTVPKISIDEDIAEPKPVPVTVEHEMEETEQANTSEAIPEVESVEFGESTRTGENGEEKATIHDCNQIPESSLSTQSTESVSSDLRQHPEEKSTQEAEDIHSHPLADLRVAVDQKNSTDDKNVTQMQEEPAPDNLQTEREFPNSAESCAEEAKSEEEQRINDEITEETGKSAPTEITNNSASEEENLEIVEHPSERSKQVDKDELQTESVETDQDKEVKTNGAKDKEEEIEVQRGENSGLEVPLTTEKDQEDLTSNKVIVAEMKADNSNAVPDKKIPMQHPEESIKAEISREDKGIKPILGAGTTEVETDELQHTEASQGAGSNKDEEAKEKNEDEAIIATRGNLTKQDEADGQSSIAEGKDQKCHDPEVKLEGSSPSEKSSLDIPHTDEAPDVSKPSEAAQALIAKNEISLATEEMVILEESRAGESTVVTEASAGSDVQLPQKDPEITTQDVLKTENDTTVASSCEPSPETTKGKEQQKLTDEREEASKKPLPTETANTSILDKETLHTDEYLSGKSKLVAEKEEPNTRNAKRADGEEEKANESKDEEEKQEVQREEISSSEVPLIVEKHPAEGKSITTETEMKEDSSSDIPDTSISLQGDPEESKDTPICSENKDIQPILVTETVEHEIDELKHGDDSEGAGSSKDEEAKEKNEDEAAAETRESVTKQDEAESQGSIAEEEDKKTHDTGIKPESSSPLQKSCTDIHEIDEPLDLSRPNEIASDIVEQDEVSFAKEGIGIPEDPQSSESAVVTITSRDSVDSTEAAMSNEDKDIQLVSELKHGDTSELAGSDNKEQADEKNEGEATVEIRRTVMEPDASEGQSNITEREDQKFCDAGKLETSSPIEKSSTDLHHIDEPQHLSRPTEILDTVEQNEVSVTTKGMEIPEEPQSSKSTVVTITSVDRDTQLTQNDPAATAAQAEIQMPKTEDYPIPEPSFEEVKCEAGKRSADDVEEASQKFESTEKANTCISDQETLQTAQDLSEKSKPLAEKEEQQSENTGRAEVVEVKTVEAKDEKEGKEVQREEDSGFDVPLIVDKNIVDDTSNETMMVEEINKYSSSDIPDKKILVQGDPEESTEAVITNEDKDVQPFSSELRHGNTSEAVGSNNNEQAKEKNKDEGTVEIGGSVLEQDESEGQRNIAEREDQKFCEAGNLESSSLVEKSSTDLHHIDEPRHLSRSTEILDTVEQNEVSVSTKGIEIPEAPQSSENTAVTITSVDRDAQLTQNDPAATAVHAEIQMPKTEDEPIPEPSSEEVKCEAEKRLADDVEEATQKFESTEIANTCTSDKETLQTAQDLSEKSKPLAEKEVQREEDSGFDVPLIVDKNIVDDIGSENMMVEEINKYSSSDIPDEKILVQGDPAESTETVISNEDKDIQPVSNELKHGDTSEVVGSNNNEQAKENKDEATVDIRGRMTEQNESEGQSNIAERENQKYCDAGELENSSPVEKSSTDLHRIDEPQHLSRTTEILDTEEQNEVSLTTKGMEIPEEPQSSESTVGSITTIDRDTQLTLNDPAATSAQTEIQMPKIENDLIPEPSSEEVKSEEDKKLTDDVEEATQKLEPMETANTCIPDKETLQTAEDLSEKSEPLAEKEELQSENAGRAEVVEVKTIESKDEKEGKEVQREEDSGFEAPLIVDKNIVDDASKETMTVAEINKYSCNDMPDNKILVQGDQEGSTEAVISNEDEDIQPDSNELKHGDTSKAVGNNTNEQAKEKNKDEATVESVMDYDDADSQRHIAEGGDQKFHDAGVKLESLSPTEKSSTDIHHHIDEPQHLSRLTEIPDKVDQNEVSATTKEMGICEEPQSSERTVVTIITVGRDAQLTQNNPAATAAQAEIQTPKAEDDPNAEPSYKKVKSEVEKKITDEVEEATVKFEPTETANACTFDKETLQTAEDLHEISKPLAEKEELQTENAEKAEVVEVRKIEAKDEEVGREVQQEEDSGSEVPLTVEKDIVDDTSIKTMTVVEIEEDSSSVIPDKKILVQEDPEESIKAVISSVDQDIEPVSITETIKPEIDEMKHGVASEAAGCSKDYQAKETNEDEATIETKESVTEWDEANGQSSKTEGEDQKIHDPNVIPDKKILAQEDTEENIGKDFETATEAIKLEIGEQKHIDHLEDARTNKDEESKENNEDEAIAKGASETKQDEADNQNSVTEGEDPKIQDRGVKLENSSSPENSSRDIHQIDEPQDHKKSSEIAEEITLLTKVSTATKAIEITEESPSSKHTEVTTTTADKDVQLLQNHSAVTAVEAEVRKANTEDDPCPTSEAATLDLKAGGTIEDSKEMEKESTSMEAATNTESEITQGYAEQTLSVAEEREIPDQLAGDHVSNHDKSSNMETVQKEVQVDLSSNTKECPEAMIFSGDEDITKPEPASSTVEHDTEKAGPGNASLAIAVTEWEEIGDHERIGECAEQKESIDDNNQTPESSKSLESTKSTPTDLGQISAKDTIQENVGVLDQHKDLEVIEQMQGSPVRSVEDCGVSDIKITQKTEELDIAPLLPSEKHTEQEADPGTIVDPENSSSHKSVQQIQEEAAAMNFQAGKEIPGGAEPSPKEETCNEKHKISDEIKEALEKSIPTEIANISAHDKETPDIAEQSSERSFPKANNEELPAQNEERAQDKEVKTDESKEEEVKSDLQTGENSGSEVPVIIEKQSVDPRSNEIIAAKMEDESSSVLPEKKIPEENIKTMICNEVHGIQPVPLAENVKLETKELKHTDVFEAAAKSNNVECGEEKRTTDEHKEKPESSSEESTKSPASDFQQTSAKETTGKAEDKECKDLESSHVPAQAKGSTFEAITKDGVNDAGITRDKAEAASPLASEEPTALKGDGKVIPEPENPESIIQVQQKATEQKTSDETQEAKGKPPPSETANIGAPLAQNFNEESKQVPKKKEELHAETAERAEGEAVKSDEESYEAPVMVEAIRDAETKVSQRKSHNILSGVGSKVKHSIAKMKKAITCTHTQTIPPSPKREY